MTVASVIATATLAWTGVETSFTPGFQAQAAGDVSVVYASSVLTETLVLDTHYAVELDGSGNVTVTPLDLPAAPATLTISRNSSLLQADSFSDGQPWSAEVIGQALDLCALRDQELRRDVDAKPGTTFASLSDVAIAEGPAIDGFVFAWDNAIAKVVAIAPSSGGGGGGAAFATTLALLAASNPSVAAVNLALGGRSGPFVWFAGNFTTEVTNDPGQAVYVAWSGDSSPGATGAWVRQWDGVYDVRFLGIVGDGVITPASGPILLPTLPTAGQTITIGATAITAVASGATGNQVNIPGTAAAFVAALLTFLQASGDGQISQCTYALDASVLTTIHATYVIKGGPAYLGNGFAMATTITGATAAALSGGSAVGTDNSQGLANLGVYGRYIASLAGGFTVFAKPGTYLYNWTNTQGCTWNWGKSKFLFMNTIWYSTDNTTAKWPWFTFTGAGHPAGYLIASTTVNSNTILPITLTDASHFKVGDPVAITSLCIQTFGYPPNVQNFEFATIADVNPVTGLLTLSKPLKYAHLSTYPDGIDAGSEACGAARVWALNIPPPFTPALTSIALPIMRWDIEPEIVGPIEVYYVGGGGQAPYLTFPGRSLTTRRWNGPGISLSVCERGKHEFDKYATPTVIDKQVGPVEYDNCNFIGLFSPQNPNEFVTARNCTFAGGLQSGTIKQLLVEQCEISSLALGGNIYGYSRKQSFKNNRIYGFAFPKYVLDGVSAAVTVDGADISYANVGGYTIIRGLKSASQFLSALPGSQIIFPAGIGGFSSDVGLGTVLSTTEDTTYSYITTDFPFASLPTANVFQYVQLYDISFEGNTGCDLAKLFSDACENGQRYFDRQRMIFDNNAAPAAGSLTSQAGVLVGVYANVRKAGTGTCGVAFRWSSLYNSSTLAATGTFPGMTVAIDGSVKGIRNITQFQFAGKAGADGILVNGATASSFLPTDAIAGWSLVSSGVGYTYTVGSGLAPVIEIILTFDTGMTRRLIDQQHPTYSGSGGDLVNIQGTSQP